MREASTIMAELGAAGLSPAQLALVMELSAAVAIEARPVVDEAAERRREKDRAYQAEKRAERRQSRTISADSYDSPAPDKSPPDPQKLTPTPHEPEKRAREDRVFRCPEGVDAQHWSDFLANRKTKRLTNTPTAYRQQLKALADLTDDEWPPGRIVEFVAASGWAAIHDPRTSYRNTGNGTHRLPGLRGTRPDPALDLMRAGEAAIAAEAAGRGTAADRGAWPALPAVGAGGP